MLLVLSSLLGTPGGIPAFNRLLVRAAVEYAARGDGRLAVVALTDDPKTVAPPAILGDALYRPCGGDRMRCIAETLRAGRRFSPLIFGHINLAPLGLIGAPVGLRYGVIAHGTEVWSPLPWHRRLALQRARVVACVSQDTARRVSAVHGVPPSRCLRIINAIENPVEDPVDTSALEVMAQPARPLRLLSVTRLHPGEPKGIDLTLRAIAELSPGSVSYTVIGEGAERPRLRALAEGLGLGGQVRFVGALGDAERDRALADCDLFVLPSSGEGFGIVYLEAMARGKPCLGARVGGTPEVVLDEATGLLVNPDVASVRRAIERLFDDALRARLGRAGQARVALHFTYDAFLRHAFALFDRLTAIAADE